MVVWYGQSQDFLSACVGLRAQKVLLDQWGIQKSAEMGQCICHAPAMPTARGQEVPQRSQVLTALAKIQMKDV